MSCHMGRVVIWALLKIKFVAFVSPHSRRPIGIWRPRTRMKITACGKYFFRKISFYIGTTNPFSPLFSLRGGCSPLSPPFATGLPNRYIYKNLIRTRQSIALETASGCVHTMRFSCVLTQVHATLWKSMFKSRHLDTFAVGPDRYHFNRLPMGLSEIGFVVDLRGWSHPCGPATLNL